MLKKKKNQNSANIKIKCAMYFYVFSPLVKDFVQDFGPRKSHYIYLGCDSASCILFKTLPQFAVSTGKPRLELMKNFKIHGEHKQSGMTTIVAKRYTMHRV